MQTQEMGCSYAKGVCRDDGMHNKHHLGRMSEQPIPWLLSWAMIDNHPQPRSVGYGDRGTMVNLDERTSMTGPVASGR